jgi:soluble lytic murein transglycosylase-like protein
VLRVGLVVLGLAAWMAQIALVSRSHAEVPSAPVTRVVRVPAVEADGSLDLRKVADYLVEAVIQVESGGDPRKIGRAGERGIMQIKRTTWIHVTKGLFGRALSFGDALDAAVNRRVGRAYLAELQKFLQEHRGEWRSDERSLLLACYNAGPTRVMEARFDPRRLPASTRSYIERATALHDYYLAENAAKIRDLLMAQRRSEAGS